MNRQQFDKLHFKFDNMMFASNDFMKELIKYNPVVADNIDALLSQVVNSYYNFRNLCLKRNPELKSG